MSTVNDPWDRCDDPLGDIELTQLALRENDHTPVFFVGESCPYYQEIIKMMDDNDAPTVVIVKGSAVGWSSEWPNVGTPGHCDHRGKSPLQTVIENIRQAELALIMFGESLQNINYRNLTERQRDLLNDNNEFKRRYMVAPEPEPVIEKPYYQDHRQNRSKKSRRKL